MLFAKCTVSKKHGMATIQNTMPFKYNYRLSALIKQIREWKLLCLLSMVTNCIIFLHEIVKNNANSSITRESMELWFCKCKLLCKSWNNILKTIRSKVSYRDLTHLLVCNPPLGLQKPWIYLDLSVQRR